MDITGPLPWGAASSRDSCLVVWPFRIVLARDAQVECSIWRAIHMRCTHSAIFSGISTSSLLSYCRVLLGLGSWCHGHIPTIDSPSMRLAWGGLRADTNHAGPLQAGRSVCCGSGPTARYYLLAQVPPGTSGRLTPRPGWNFADHSSRRVLEPSILHSVSQEAQSARAIRMPRAVIDAVVRAPCPLGAKEARSKGLTRMAQCCMSFQAHHVDGSLVVAARHRSSPFAVKSTCHGIPCSTKH